MANYPQVPASPDQIDSETSHKVSAPPNLDSSGVSQQESAPFSSNDMEYYPQISASPDQIHSETSHKVSAPPNLDSSGISQQESAPFSSDTENFPQVSASPDQNSSDNTKRSKKNTSRTQRLGFLDYVHIKENKEIPHRSQRN